MKLTLLFSAAIFSVSMSHAAVYSLTGSLDVFQALTNPSNVGNGTGTIIGSYDDVTNLLDYTITYADLSGAPTVMHFHLGAPGVSGGVQLDIPNGPSPRVGTGVALTEANEANLLAGNWYVNIHTANFTGGEIRGQVNVAPIPEPSAPLLLVGSLSFLALRRRRS